MQYRTFGRTGWKVSELGYGMWGMGSWSGSDDKESERSLDLALELGCNFFDTAWFYGKGKSENLLGAMVKRHPGKKLYIATKIPPKNFVWPPKIDATLEECFPNDHIFEYTEKSLKNLGGLWRNYRAAGRRVAELKHVVKAEAEAQRHAVGLRERELLALLHLERDTRTLIVLNEIYSLWRKAHVPLSWLMWWLLVLHVFAWAYY